MSKARLEIVRALIAQEDKKTRALCARLGVSPDLPPWQRWGEIGQKLAPEQKEFKSKRAGRPLKAKLSSVQLAELVDRLQADMPQKTAKEILEVAKKMDPKNPLFLSDIATRQKSVSQGRAIIRGKLPRLTKNSRRILTK